MLHTPSSEVVRNLFVSRSRVRLFTILFSASTMAIGALLEPLRQSLHLTSITLGWVVYVIVGVTLSVVLSRLLMRVIDSYTNEVSHKAVDMAVAEAVRAEKARGVATLLHTWGDHNPR